MNLLTTPQIASSFQLTPLLAEGQLRIVMKGTFDMEAAIDLAHFFGSVMTDVKELSLTNIVIDAAEVYYLGSSCIKSLVTLIGQLKACSFHPQLRVVISPQLDWHERAFAILVRLSPRQVTIEKAP